MRLIVFEGAECEFKTSLQTFFILINQKFNTEINDLGGWFLALKLYSFPVILFFGETKLSKHAIIKDRETMWRVGHLLVSNL